MKAVNRMFIKLINVAVVLIALARNSLAQDGSAPTAGSAAAAVYALEGDVVISTPMTTMLHYVEGAFGALVMITSALLGILFSVIAFKARGQKRRWWVSAGLMFAIAVGTFLVRGFFALFFDYSIPPP